MMALIVQAVHDLRVGRGNWLTDDAVRQVLDRLIATSSHPSRTATALTWQSGALTDLLSGQLVSDQARHFAASFLMEHVRDDWLKRPDFPLLVLPLLSGTKEAALAAGAPHPRSLQGGTHFSLLARIPSNSQWFHYDSMGPGSSHHGLATRLAHVMEHAVRTLPLVRLLGKPKGREESRAEMTLREEAWIGWITAWLKHISSSTASIRHVAVPMQSEATCGLHTLMYAATLMDKQRALEDWNEIQHEWSRDQLVRVYLPRFIQLLESKGSSLPMPPRLVPPATSMVIPMATPRASPVPVHLREALVSFILQAYRLLRATKSADKTQWDTIGAALRDVLIHTVNAWPSDAGTPRTDILDIWLDLFKTHEGTEWMVWIRGIEDGKRDSIVESMLRAFVVHGMAMNQAWSDYGSVAYRTWVQQQVEQLFDLHHVFGLGSMSPSLIEQTWFCCRCGRRTMAMLCTRVDCAT